MGESVRGSPTIPILSDIYNLFTLQCSTNGCFVGGRAYNDHGYGYKSKNSSLSSRSSLEWSGCVRCQWRRRRIVRTDVWTSRLECYSKTKNFIMLLLTLRLLSMRGKCWYRFILKPREVLRCRYRQHHPGNNNARSATFRQQGQPSPSQCTNIRSGECRFRVNTTPDATQGSTEQWFKRITILDQATRQGMTLHSLRFALSYRELDSMLVVGQTSIMPHRCCGRMTRGWW